MGIWGRIIPGSRINTRINTSPCGMNGLARHFEEDSRTWGVRGRMMEEGLDLIPKPIESH